jgi:hypothetical protein
VGVGAGVVLPRSSELDAEAVARIQGKVNELPSPPACCPVSKTTACCIGTVVLGLGTLIGVLAAAAGKAHAGGAGAGLEIDLPGGTDLVASNGTALDLFPGVAIIGAVGNVTAALALALARLSTTGRALRGPLGDDPTCASVACTRFDIPYAPPSDVAPELAKISCAGVLSPGAPYCAYYPSLTVMDSAANSQTVPLRVTVGERPTPTPGVSASPWPSLSATGTLTPTITATVTVTVTPTASDTSGRSATPTATYSPSASISGSETPTATYSPSASISGSTTPTATYSPSASISGSTTPTPTDSGTGTHTPTATYTPTASDTPHLSPSPGGDYIVTVVVNNVVAYQWDALASGFVPGSDCSIGPQKVVFQYAQPGTGRTRSTAESCPDGATCTFLINDCDDLGAAVAQNVQRLIYSGQDQVNATLVSAASEGSGKVAMTFVYNMASGIETAPSLFGR